MRPQENGEKAKQIHWNFGVKRPRHIPVESFLPFVQTSGHRLKGLSVLSRQFGSRAKIRSQSLTVFSGRRK